MKDLQQTKRPPNTVLFLCAKNYYEGRLAQLLFAAEAKKMDVDWLPTCLSLDQHSNEPMDIPDFDALAGLINVDRVQFSRSIDQVTIEDLQDSGLVVFLQRDEETYSVKDSFPSWKGSFEIWEIPQSPNSLQTVLSNVKSLLIRLILKGGKRPPNIVSQPPKSQNVTRESATTSARPTAKSSVRVFLDAKGRKGKKVTVISGLPLNEAALIELATKLKQVCGSGGTVKDQQIEIQGDHRDRLLQELQSSGYKAKRSGG